MTHSFVNAYIAAVVGLFPIVNPLGMTPIFLRLTAGASDEVRSELALRIAVGGCALMAGSLFLGSHILSFFGLTIPAVQVAGGLVVVSAGWRMLQEGDDTNAREQRSGVTDDMVLTRAFFPLTMPLTVGPGAISVAITLGARSASGGPTLAVSAGGLLGVATVALSICLCYRFAERVLRRMGATGTDVVVRLSSFLMLCLGVQIIRNGIAGML